MLELSVDRKTDIVITMPDGKRLRIALLETRIEQDGISKWVKLGFDGPREFKISRENVSTNGSRRR